MNDSEHGKAFSTLSGFFNGEEPDDEESFFFSATLRIHGNNLPFEEISQRLGVNPTRTHRKGERRGSNSLPYVNDAWQFQAPLPESEPLERHIESLWLVVKPEIEYLKSLKDRFKVDIFCGYRSNNDMAGFEVSHKCLELFIALEVPFGVSVIIA